MDEQSMQNKTADQLKLQGNQAFKNKQFQKAIQLYSQAIRINPEDHSFYSNRAICYYNVGNYTESIIDCNECLKYNPTFVKALRRRGMSQTQILKFDDAIASFSKAYQIQKDITINNQLQAVQSYKSNYDRYFQHMNNAQYTEALKCINYLCNKIPNNQQLKMYKVQSLAKTGQTADALTLIKTIPMAHTGNPDFYYLKGLIELYGGDSARAKKYFAEGMRLDPDHTQCRQSLNKAKKCQQLKQQGNQLIKQQKYQQAQLKYTQAINLDPANKKLNSVIYSNRAQTWIKRKQNLKALDDLNKSLQLDPNYTKSLMRRAQINMERGQFTAAIMDYSKIQQLDSSANLKAKIKDAQKKQKQAKKKDYYKILQVDRNASEADIKKSYKKLALKYHPDRNSSKSQSQQAEASKMFKQIAQAYGVLTDPKKKQLYDSGQMQYDGDQGMGGNGMNIDPNDIFQMFFGGGMGGGMSGFGGMGGMGGSNFSRFTSGGAGKGGKAGSYTFKFG